MKVPFHNIDERILLACDKAMEIIKDRLSEIDEIQDYNTQKCFMPFKRQV